MSFFLERGLHQGNPLYPLLFLLVAEGIKVMMNAMVDNRLFSGYNVEAQNALSITHYSLLMIPFCLVGKVGRMFAL